MTALALYHLVAAVRHLAAPPETDPCLPGRTPPEKAHQTAIERYLEAAKGLEYALRERHE